MVCQIAKVNKMLASIGQICDKGNDVVFRKDGGDIINIETKRKTPFRRLGNVYVMDAWIRNPAWTDEESDNDKDEPLMGFTRQGVSR